MRRYSKLEQAKTLRKVLNIFINVKKSVYLKSTDRLLWKTIYLHLRLYLEKHICKWDVFMENKHLEQQQITGLTQCIKGGDVFPQCIRLLGTRLPQQGVNIMP